MKTSELKSGYMVATDEYPVRIYSTLEEAESHIKFQREHMKSKKTWYIVRIKLSDWNTFKYEEPNDDHITCWFRNSVEDIIDIDLELYDETFDI